MSLSGASGAERVMVTSANTTAGAASLTMGSLTMGSLTMGSLVIIGSHSTSGCSSGLELVTVT